MNDQSDEVMGSSERQPEGGIVAVTRRISQDTSREVSAIGVATGTEQHDLEQMVPLRKTANGLFETEDLGKGFVDGFDGHIQDVACAFHTGAAEAEILAGVAENGIGPQSADERVIVAASECVVAGSFRCGFPRGVASNAGKSPFRAASRILNKKNLKKVRPSCAGLQRQTPGASMGRREMDV